jgi:hypothetical protein
VLPGLRYGVNTFLFHTDTERVLTLVENARFGWIRQQVHWRDIEGKRGDFQWATLDAAVEAANRRQVKVLLSVVRSPPWATASGDTGLPDHPSDAWPFFRMMAERYRGRVAAYEVWNEPNLAIENGGTPATPGEYLELLQTAYAAIKDADPCALVLAAPLAATAVSDPAVARDDLAFYEELYTLKGGAFKWSADAVAVHPGGGAFSPRAMWPPDAPDRSHFYFRHIERVRDVMVRHGDERRVWITEVGWTVAAVAGAPLPVSPERQAEYLVDALVMTQKTYPWVAGIFVWNLNFGVMGTPGDEKAGFGILDADWSPRPAYTALQGMLHTRWRQYATLETEEAVQQPLQEGE